MNRLGEMTCIVTGAAKGMGKSTCQRLADEGAKVAVTDLDDKDGTAVRDAIRQSARLIVSISDDQPRRSRFGAGLTQINA